ncbi:ATP-binding protein [Spongisporangium articulatum]|uniref:ATP-binding protein n=1 Tax=Spongisporangium articulatum TaxID=3362603 RepID=A0ABW8AIY2_9ACTN
MELRFPPSAGHVRTARLVAVAVARRAGFDAARLDELRTAVGEACARAVNRCLEDGCAEDILLGIEDAGPGLTVEVLDGAAPVTPDDPLAIALLQGLADAVEVLPGKGGPAGLIRLEWWQSGSTASPPVQPRGPVGGS